MRKHHLPQFSHWWIIPLVILINTYGVSAQDSMLAYQPTTLTPLRLPALKPLKSAVIQQNNSVMYLPIVSAKPLGFKVIFLKKEKKQSIMHRPRIKKCPDRANALNPYVCDYLQQLIDPTSIEEKGFKYRFRVLTDGSLKRYVMDHSERIEFDREVIRVLKNRSREVLAARGTYRAPIWMTANVKFYL